jgi:hypothetical protein
MRIKALHGRRPLGGVSVMASGRPRAGTQALGNFAKATVAAITSLLAACASSPDVFASYRERAVKDYRTPEAQAYVQALLPVIGADLASLLKECATEFPEDSSPSFELVFHVDHWGEPKAILVDPRTSVSACVASGVFLFAFPHPPARFEKGGLTMMLPIAIR